MKIVESENRTDADEAAQLITDCQYDKVWTKYFDVNFVITFLVKVGLTDSLILTQLHLMTDPQNHQQTTTVQLLAVQSKNLLLSNQFSCYECMLDA